MLSLGLVLLAVALGLGWFALGLWAVWRERRRAGPVEDRDLLELVDVLCAELGCRRPLEVRQSAAVATAATIGWRRPTLLLSADWADWTPDQRRAILAHEIAHARSNDYLALLVAQIGLSLHFYHPLVHWLVGRLRLEQELAADAAAAGVSGGQRRYLTTIAELALRQQDRPLLWPARAFLPTRTTFLRRIAMLRDTRLCPDRLSTAGRWATVGAVLLCGLAVSGFRAPGGAPAALADATEPAAAATADDVIDTTYMMKKAEAMVVIRPPAELAKPELAGLAKLLDTSGNMVPKGTHVTDFRQIMAFVTDVPSGQREVVVYQWIKPVAEAELTRLMAGKKFEVQDVDGKKMYVVSRDGNTRKTLLLDEYTCVDGSENAMAAYLASKRGVLPPWLSAKAWESFQSDQIVMAGDTARMREETEAGMQHSPFLIQAAYGSLLPLLDNATSLAAGVRLDQGQVSVHAHAIAKDAESIEQIQKTVEAIKLIGQSALKGVRTRVDAEQDSGRAWKATLLDTYDSLLTNAKFDRAGVEASLATSAKLDIAQLAAVLARADYGAQRTQVTENLRMIALAMHNYHDNQGRFPPAVLYGPDRRTPYSWRVALLPYLAANDVYQQYRFDEPWDGPNNHNLLQKMPDVFRSPSEPADSINASYFVLTGPGTMFDGKKETRIMDVRDGTSNTLLVVEAKRDIPWTKPEDIAYDPAGPLPKLGGFFEDGFNVALADGSARFFPTAIDEKTLRLLITKDGRELVNIDDAMSAATATASGRNPSTQEGMTALVEDFIRHNYRDIASRKTIEWGDYAKTPEGNFSIRYKYLAYVSYAETKIWNEVFTFDPRGKFVSVTDVKGYPIDVDGNPQAVKPPRKVYEVNKKVADFPDGEDLSTPEAAYASIQRAYAAEGNAAFKRLSVPGLAEHMPEGKKEPLPEEAARLLLDAEVLEVHTWDGDHATVIARIEDGRGRSHMDLRSLLLVEGRWLNKGNDNTSTLDEARRKIERWSGRPAEDAGDGARADGRPRTSLTGNAAEGDAQPAGDKTVRTTSTIVEGVGWKNLKVGMSREALIQAMGKPDADSTNDWLKWARKHIDCTFHTGATGVSEIRFNKGFKGKLANGLRVGGPDRVVELYGEPEAMKERGAAVQREYSSKGILFWSHQGRITQIVVFKPYELKKPGDAASTSGNQTRVSAVSPEEVRKAEAGDYWSQYRLWSAYHKGEGGVAKDAEKAQRWLAELVKDAHLATFKPVGTFNPKTPREFLTEFNKHSSLRSEPEGLGGASFFRTRVEQGKLIGSFLTAYPDRMREAIEANPSLELISITEISPEEFVRYEASAQERLPIVDPAASDALPAGARPATDEELRRLVDAAEASPARAVHVAAQMRTLPHDNFSLIGAEFDFVPVSVWKSFEGKSPWRVEKPQRVVVMNGDKTVMLIRNDVAVEHPQPSRNAFDTWWLLALASTKEIIDIERRMGMEKGWRLMTADETTDDGAKSLLLIVEAKSELPDDDRIKNRFFGEADMRREYRFDPTTGRLERMEAYLHHATGDVKVFATERITYDPRIDPAVFSLEPPEDVQWVGQPERLPDNEKYERMTSAEAARAFFEACAKEDWPEATKFYQGMLPRMKTYLGGLEIVQLGEPEASKAYPGRFIPYEIRLRDGNTKSGKLAIRKDNPANRYVVAGGL